MGIWGTISSVCGWVTPVRPKRCLLLPLLLGSAGRCVDRAAPEYLRCGQLETSGDLPGALAAREGASKADPGGFSGKSATGRLTSIKVKLAAKTAAEEVASAAAAAAGAAERSHLVSSASPDDWRMLISKYPGTPEAQSAETKLKESVSVCANLESWRLGIPPSRREVWRRGLHCEESTWRTGRTGAREHPLDRRECARGRQVRARRSCSDPSACCPAGGRPRTELVDSELPHDACAGREMGPGASGVRRKRRIGCGSREA